MSLRARTLSIISFSSLTIDCNGSPSSSSIISSNAFLAFYSFVFLLNILLKKLLKHAYPLPVYLYILLINLQSKDF